MNKRQIALAPAIKRAARALALGITLTLGLASCQTDSLLPEADTGDSILANQPQGTITALIGNKPLANTDDQAPDTRTVTHPATLAVSWAVGDAVHVTHHFNLTDGTEENRPQTLTVTSLADGTNPDQPAGTPLWTANPRYVSLPAGATAVNTSYTFEPGVKPLSAASDPEVLLAPDTPAQPITTPTQKLTATPQWTRPGALVQISNPAPGVEYTLRVIATHRATAKEEILHTYRQTATVGTRTLDFHLAPDGGLTLPSSYIALCAQLTADANPLSTAAPYRIDRLAPAVAHSTDASRIAPGADDPQTPLPAFDPATMTVLNANYRYDDPQNLTFDPGKTIWYVVGGGDAADADAKVCHNTGVALEAQTTAPDGTYTVLLTQVKTISGNAFLYNQKLGAVQAPRAASVAPSAFSYCAALKAVSLPAATTIGNGAFWGCEALKAVSLPAATTIGIGAFGDCNKLATVSLPAMQETLGVLSNLRALSSVHLPLVKKIYQGEFVGCTSLTTIELPALTRMESGAFAGCTNIETVRLPLVGEIVRYAFRNLTNLKSVEAPVATKVGGDAFSECAALTTVSLPKATEVGSYAFDRCAALTELTLTAEGAITLHADAFAAFTNVANCTLHLNADKQPGGAGTPQVDANGKTWGGKTWKEIK